MTTSQNEFAQPGLPAEDAEPELPDERGPWVSTVLLLTALCFGLAFYALVKSTSHDSGADGDYRSWVYRPLLISGSVDFAICAIGIVPVCFRRLTDRARRAVVASVLLTVVVVLFFGVSSYGSRRDVGRHLLAVATGLAPPAGVTHPDPPTLRFGTDPSRFLTLRSPYVFDTWTVPAGSSTACTVVSSYAKAHPGSTLGTDGCSAVVHEGIAQLRLSATAAAPRDIALEFVPRD